MIRRIRAWFSRSAPGAEPTASSGGLWKHGLGIGAVALVLAGIVAAGLFRLHPFSPLVFDAVLAGERRLVAAPFAGTVAEILVEPDQIVRTGEPLALILPDQTGGGRISPAVREEMKNRFEAAQKEEEQALEAVQRAALAHARAQVALYGNGSGTTDGLPARRNRAELKTGELRATAVLEAARSKYEAASTARRRAQDAYRQAREAGGEARRERISPETATAPQNGRIERLSVSKGASVQAGQALMALAPITADQFWVAGYVNPDRADELPAGRALTLRLTAQKLRMAGSVVSVRQTGQTDGEDGGKARAIPVRIRLDGYDPLTMPMLQLGQDVEVSAD